MRELMRLDWWPDFQTWLVNAVPRHDWPKSPEFWDVLEDAIAGLGPGMSTLDVCKQGASKLILEGWPFPSDLPPRLLVAIRDAYRTVLSSQCGNAIQTRADATRASLDCPDCGGMGFTYRFQHGGETPGRCVSFYCLCPAGRWIERAHREGDEECRTIHAQSLDLAKHPELQLHPVAWSSSPDHRCRFHPRDWDAENDCPRPAPERSPSDGETGGSIRLPVARRRRFERPVPNVFEVPSCPRKHSADAGDF